MSRPARKLSAEEARWLAMAWARPDVTVENIRSHLAISWGPLKEAVAKLGLGPKPGGYARWSRERTAQLLAFHAEGHGTQAIIQRFRDDFGVSMTPSMVIGKLFRLGLRVNVDGIAKPCGHTRLCDEKLARLRRVAAWDSAARRALAAYEREIAA